MKRHLWWALALACVVVVPAVAQQTGTFQHFNDYIQSLGTSSSTPGPNDGVPMVQGGTTKKWLPNGSFLARDGSNISDAQNMRLNVLPSPVNGYVLTGNGTDWTAQAPLSGGMTASASNATLPDALTNLGLGTTSAPTFQGLNLTNHTNLAGAWMATFTRDNPSGGLPSGSLQGPLFAARQLTSYGGAATDQIYVIGSATEALSAVTDGGINTTLTANAVVGASTITVAAATGFINGRFIHIIRDDGLEFVTTEVGAPSGNVITLAGTMPAQASSGAIVYSPQTGVQGGIAQGTLTSGSIGHNLVAFEASTSARAGSLPYTRAILGATHNSDDVVPALGPYDSSIFLSSQGGATKSKVGISFDPRSGDQAVATTGALIKSFDGTYATGVDFSQSSFSGYAWKSPNATITGAGQINGTILVGSSTIRTTGNEGSQFQLATSGAEWHFNSQNAAGGGKYYIQDFTNSKIPFIIDPNTTAKLEIGTSGNTNTVTGNMLFGGVGDCSKKICSTDINASTGVYDNGTAPTGTVSTGYVRAGSPTITSPTFSSGATLGSGTLTGVPTPSNASDAVPKSYADSISSGIVTHAAAAAATTANLNATAAGTGVGHTLTNAGAQAAFAVDGYTASLNDRILVKDQTTQKDNGIYTVTTVGTGASNWVLTRATDFDQASASEVAAGASVIVIQGSTNARTQWVETGQGPFTVDTTAIIFSGVTSTSSGTINSGSANQLAYYAGAGTTLSGLTTANNGVLITSAGGVPSISSTIPSATQANITSVGTLASGVWNGTKIGLAYGGTNADLSATGGTSQVLKQASVGANVTVGTLSCSDLSDDAASCSTDTTNASNISSGTLASARGGAGTVTGALKGNGLGSVSQAACADLSNGAAGCSSSTGTSGHTLPFLDGANTWSAAQTFGTVMTSVNQQVGTTYTLLSSDCGKTVEITNASAITVTLPNNLSIGCHVAIVQGGAGQITVSAQAGGSLVSAHAYTKTFGQSAGIGLSVLENSGGSAAKWFLFGDGA